MVRDPCTFSNYEELQVQSYDFNWNVDFEHKTLTGSVDIKVEAKVPAHTLILDGRDLAIRSVSVGDQHLKFEIESEEVRGQKINIDIPPLSEGQELTVTIHYSTAPEARALQFLTKEQTTDQKVFYAPSPFHARSILPCMDTPSSKSKYTAKVGVPSGLTCLMSAIAEKKELFCDRSVFSFQQEVPIPPYLIAIVVGNLEKREISGRCAVWSEPSMADAARFEFEETENVLKVAEELAGKYVWGRYDMVVLPATFPFGGMENPCLTFITPTIIAGDKSLVNVVAHEISHSWTGNLVTNASWEHFWLNEGFTVFLERKIHGRMFGELERQFESEKGFDEALVPTVRDVFGPVHEFTKLIQNQTGIDPDDAFSSVPYEKIGRSIHFYQLCRSSISSCLSASSVHQRCSSKRGEAAAEKTVKKATMEQRVIRQESKAEPNREQRKLKVEKLHPGYRTIIRDALLELDADSSLQDVLQYLMNNFIPSEVPEKKVHSYLAHAIKKGVKNGELIHTPANKIRLSKSYLDDIRAAKRVESEEEFEDEDDDFDLYYEFLSQFYEEERLEGNRKDIRKRKNPLPKMNNSDALLVDNHGSKQNKRTLTNHFIDSQMQPESDISFGSEDACSEGGLYN